MDYKLNIEDLSNPRDLAKLVYAISELADQLDILYTETAPDGAISARIGRIAIYKNGATYETWQNIDGDKDWQRIDKDAVTVTDEKVKASSDDPTADYLDGKVASSITISSEKLVLVGDEASPGNDKVYGTTSAGAKGWKDDPTTSLRFQIFTSNGTFTAPAGVTKVFITACAGGGGGGAGGAINNRAGGGGGAGESISRYVYTVVPSNNYTVTIGAGGAGGNQANGVAGSNTSFDSLTLTGGGYGTFQDNGGPGGSGGGTTTSRDASGSTEGDGRYKGGNGAAGNVGGNLDGGGGGATLFGAGGTGGLNDGGGQNGENAIGYGCGGGGGGYGSNTLGGDGEDGVVLVEW